MNTPSVVALALLAVGTCNLAAAQDVGQHPAVFAPRSLPGVNPNTFIVGHPASPRWHASHANSDHPAVALAAAARAHGHSVDINTYLVQPPATVRWTMGTADEGSLVAVAAATHLATAQLARQSN